MQRQYDSAVDFTKGMNTEVGLNADEDAPYFLQDAILTRGPELWRRSGYSMVDIHEFVSGSTGANMPGDVLASYLHGYGGSVGTIYVVTYPTVTGGGITRVVHVPNGSTGWETTEVIVQFNRVATVADICAGPRELGDDNQPSTRMGFLVTTDVGTAWCYWHEEFAAEHRRIAGVAVDEPHGYDYALDGAGYRHCAYTNGYAFLANREAGRGARARRDYIWWSKLGDTNKWRNTFDPTDLRKGGYQAIPVDNTSNITGLHALGKDLLVFRRNTITKIQVSDNPSEWGMNIVASEGTLDSQTIDNYDGGVIFANNHGVYIFSGYETTCISDPIASHYEKAMRGYKNDWRLTGRVHNDYYILSIRKGPDAKKNPASNENPYNTSSPEHFKHVVTYMVHIPTGNWTTLSNLPLATLNVASRGGKFLWGVLTSNVYDSNRPGGIINLHKIFELPKPYESFPLSVDDKVMSEASDRQIVDAAGVGGDTNNDRFPCLQIKTRFRTMGDPFTRKTLRAVTIDYKMVNENQNTDKILAVSVQKGHKGQAIQSILSGGLTHNGTFTQRRIPCLIRDQAFSVEIKELPHANRRTLQCAISGIQLAFKPMRPGRIPNAAD